MDTKKKLSFDGYLAAVLLITAILVGRTHYQLAAKMTFTPNYPSAIGSALLYAFAVGFSISALRRRPGRAGKALGVVTLIAAICVGLVAHERYGSYWFKERTRKMILANHSSVLVVGRKSNHDEATA